MPKKLEKHQFRDLMKSYFDAPTAKKSDTAVQITPAQVATAEKECKEGTFLNSGLGESKAELYMCVAGKMTAIANGQVVRDTNIASYRNGYSAGYSSGEAAGYSSGEANGWGNGYEAGKSIGTEDGIIEGEVAGLKVGYQIGYQIGYEDGVTVLTNALLYSAVMETIPPSNGMHLKYLSPLTQSPDDKLDRQ